MLGFTFKENCPDIRNTKAYDLYDALSALGLEVKVIDPWANKEEVKAEYSLDIANQFNPEDVDVMLLTVGHEELIRECVLLKEKKYIYDFKGLLD